METSITDIAFHRTDPTRLFAASEDGDLIQFSHRSNDITDRIENKTIATANVDPWLCSIRTNKINVSIKFIFYE